VAAVLEDGVDVDADPGERAGDSGYDAGTVFYDEAEVVRGGDVAGDLQRLCREADGGAAFGDGEDIAHDGYRGGVAAGAVAAEDYVAAKAAAGDDHVLRAVRPGDG